MQCLTLRRNRHAVSPAGDGRQDLHYQGVQYKAEREVMSNRLGGRFSEGVPTRSLRKSTSPSTSTVHLYAQDIAASKAHAAMLPPSIITAGDAKNIGKG